MLRTPFARMHPKRIFSYRRWGRHCERAIVSSFAGQPSHDSTHRRVCRLDRLSKCSSSAIRTRGTSCLRCYGAIAASVCSEEVVRVLSTYNCASRPRRSSKRSGRRRLMPCQWFGPFLDPIWLPFAGSEPFSLPRPIISSSFPAPLRLASSRR